MKVRRKVAKLVNSMGYENAIELIKTLRTKKDLRSLLVLRELLSIVIPMTRGRDVSEDQFWLYELINIGRINKAKILAAKGKWAPPPKLLKPSNRVGDYVSRKGGVRRR